MVDFAGWAMPVQYNSIVEEHTATRSAAGLFDVSHMGRLRFDGADAAAFLDRILTRRVIDLETGRIRYSLVTNAEGHVLDDVLVYHQHKPSGDDYHMLVVNASNRAKIVSWLKQQLRPQDRVVLLDQTEQTAMVALQGPAALDIVAPLVDADLAALPYYHSTLTQQMGKPCIISRTGYSGEDGVELIIRAEEATQVVNNLFASGRDKGIVAAGLGARDTLRLEAALPLYGHELDEKTDPYQAGLGFAVSLKDADGQPREFIGCQRLAELAEQTRAIKRIGLALEGRRAAREGYQVFLADQLLGSVTSGSFSPTLEHPIAMAYLNVQDNPAVGTVGTELEVDIRGSRQTARVVKLPFYKRDK